MLSDIPPSTETYVRSPSSGLTVPTSYSVKAVGPTMARPGSTEMRGVRSRAPSHSRVTISVSALAISCGSRGSSSLVYAMPSPPPRSISGSSTPCSSRMSLSSPTTRCAATSNPDMSKICDPMCEWIPMTSSPSSCRARRTASAACPPASGMPNFWSSWAVAMNSCVCASTPTVMRICTRWRLPSSCAMWATRTISWKESSTIRPTPARTARSISCVDLLLPWKAIRSAGIPAERAVASSPPEQTSRLSPSSCSHRTTARDRNALPA
ncbi:hypothetical protein SVIOM342S_01680 [Streptomyces violaceorubidus]